MSTLNDRDDGGKRSEGGTMPTSDETSGARKALRLVGYAATGFAALFVAMCSVAVATNESSDGERSAEPAAVQAAAEQAVQAPAAAPKPPPQTAPSGPAETIASNGTFLVGKDIEPGTYRGNTEVSSMCFWKRLSGLSGEISDTIASEIEQGPAIVKITQTDKAFRTQGCGTWERVE